MTSSLVRICLLAAIISCRSCSRLGRLASDNKDVLTIKSPEITTAEFARDGVVNARRQASNQKSSITEKDVTNFLGKCSSCDTTYIEQKIKKFGAKSIVNASNPSKNNKVTLDWTCLHYAAYFDCHNLIPLLIENGADPDPKDHYGETPLRRAIRYTPRDLFITTIIKFGASLEKTKESKNMQWHFNKGMSNENTKAAIEEGQKQKAILVEQSRTRLVEDGRLEVKINGTWGTVCHVKEPHSDGSYRRRNLAQVVCKSLGFSKGSYEDYPLQNGKRETGFRLFQREKLRFAAKEVPIFMDYVVWCNGNERSIHDCHDRYPKSYRGTCARDLATYGEHTTDVFIKCS